jgi:translocation and assembly module TamB
MRPVWTTLALLGLLFGLLLGLLTLLLYHPSAPAWILQQVRAHSALTIEVETLQGPLAGPLRLRGLRLQNEETGIAIETLDLTWRPAALLSGEFHLVSMVVSGVDLALPADPPAEDSPASTGFDGLVLPVSLRIDQLALNGMVIEHGEGDPVQIDRVSLVARSQAEELQIERLELDMPSLSLQSSGMVGLAAPLSSDLALAWRYESTDEIALQGSGEISGDLKRLLVTQTLSGPVSGRLAVSLNDLLDDLSWDADASLNPSDLAPWLDDFPLRAGGQLRTHGTPERFALEADLALSQPDYGEASVTLRGEYGEERFHAERLQIATPAGSRLQLSGDYLPDAELGRFDVQLAWQDLRWPLQGEPSQVESSQGALRIHGAPSAYDYRLDTELKIPGQPSARIESVGNGDLQRLRLEQLLAIVEPGRLRGEGEFRWEPTLSWRLLFEGKGIDPARWVDELPGSIDLKGETGGQSGTAGLSAEIHLAQLQGRVRNYPVAAQGHAELEGERLKLDNLRLSSGANRIEVTGEVAERLDLAWRIDAQELQGVWPGLGGSLEGGGRLLGSPQAPRLQVELSGRELVYQDTRVDGVTLEGDLAYAGDQRLSLDLQAKGLHTAAGNWQALDLTLSGALPAHQLTLTLDGDDLPRVALAVDAGWSDEPFWQGRLERLELAPPGQPSWQLVEPVDFALGADSHRLERFCLNTVEASLCGETQGDPATGWRVAADAHEIPLMLLQPWLPEGVQIDGRSELAANLSQAAEGQLQGQWRLRLSEGSLGSDLEREEERIDISAGELLGSIDRRGASMQLNLPLAGLGEVRGKMALPGFDPLSLDPATQKLQGDWTVTLNDLSRFAQLSPRLLDPRGEVQGRFTVAGTLVQPQLFGSAKLQGGALDIPELGLELRQISLQLTAPNHQRIALQGSLHSGKGQLKLAGEMELDAEAGFPARLQLDGSRLTVSNLPEAEVRVSPQLSLQRDRQGTHLKGRIDIPYARLRPRALPKTAVTVSPDLVVIGADAQEQRAFDPQLSTELRVVLGKRVSIDGFGLRGQLTGSLLVIDEPKRPVIGRGRIGISEGTYRAYGQDLTIERGYALFVDSPVENPGLDVQAVRELEGVTAGVRVGGTLKRPKIDLFSSPSMPEGDILSYLLTGRAPGEGGGAGVGIAAALRASGAGMVAEEIGRQIGLEELRLDAGNGLEEAAVVAGTYLSPRLYIQYINELASRQTKVRLRYDINKRLQLEAETGKTQAGDLYYTFDR